MADETCDSIGGNCDTEKQRLASLENAVAVMQAQLKGFDSRLCDLQAQAVTNISFGLNGVVTITRGNGLITEETSPYLVQLLNAVNVAINDTNKIIGGEIDLSGNLTLFRPNSVTVPLGNIPAVANPARDIQIRNDGRIEITLLDGVSKFSTNATIQSAVNIPGGGGGGNFDISTLTTPVVAVDASYNQSGTVDIAALPGVTVPVGTTHAILRTTLQHHYLNPGQPQEPNWSKVTLAGKDVCYAGRRNTNGSEPDVGGYTISDTNSATQAIPLSGSNDVAWSTVSDFAGSSSPSFPSRVKVRAIVEVMGFILNGASQ